MKTGTTDLLKFKRLQKRLRESVRGTVGLLELLWVGTAKNAPRGDIGKFTDEEIALLVDWDGDPDALVTALIECGWIDVDDESRLVVHDWPEHCPTYIKGNLRRHGKEFAGQPTKEVAKEPAKEVATNPNPSSPNQSPPLPPADVSAEATWEEVEKSLRDLGAKAPGGALEKAQKRGESPADVATRIGHWSASEGKYNVAQLVANIGKGWQPDHFGSPSDEWKANQEEERRQAERKRQLERMQSQQAETANRDRTRQDEREQRDRLEGEFGHKLDGLSLEQLERLAQEAWPSGWQIELSGYRKEPTGHRRGDLLEALRNRGTLQAAG